MFGETRRDVRESVSSAGWTIVGKFCSCYPNLLHILYLWITKDTYCIDYTLNFNPWTQSCRPTYFLWLYVHLNKEFLNRIFCHRSPCCIRVLHSRAASAASAETSKIMLTCPNALYCKCTISIPNRHLQEELLGFSRHCMSQENLVNY